MALGWLALRKSKPGDGLYGDQTSHDPAGVTVESGPVGTPSSAITDIDGRYGLLPAELYIKGGKLTIHFRCILYGKNRMAV